MNSEILLSPPPWFTKTRYSKWFTQLEDVSTIAIPFIQLQLIKWELLPYSEIISCMYISLFMSAIAYMPWTMYLPQTYHYQILSSAFSLEFISAIPLSLTFTHLLFSYTVHLFPVPFQITFLYPYTILDNSYSAIKPSSQGDFSVANMVILFVLVLSLSGWH